LRAESDQVFWICLVVIAALGLAVRLFANAGKEVWLDELFTLQAAAEPTLGGLYRNYLLEDVHPPLYNVLAWLTVQAFGVDHETLRILSIVISMATLLGLALAGRRWLGVWPALFATYLFAVLQPCVYFAVEARAGALAMGLGLWFSFAWVLLSRRIWLREELGYHQPFFLGLAGGLLSLTSYPGLAFVGFGYLLLVVVVLVKRPSGWAWALVAPATSLLLFAPWLPTFFYHLRPRTFWAESVSFLGSFTETFAFLLDPYLPLYTLAGLVALTAVRAWLSTGEERRPIVSISLGFLILCVGFVVVLISGLAVAGSEKFLPRMMVVVLPGVLIVVAAGISSLVRRFPLATKAGVIVAAAGLAVAVAVPSIRKDRLVPVGIRHNSGLETTADWVGEHYRPGARLAIVPYQKESNSDDINYGWTKDSLEDAFNYVLAGPVPPVDKVIETPEELANFCQSLSGEALLWQVHSPLPEGWGSDPSCQVQEIRTLNAGHALYSLSN
jgi:uncharacterized membrane protein